MGGTQGASRGTGGAEWERTEARRGNALSDGPRRRKMAAVPKVQGWPRGREAGQDAGTEGSNGNGGVALLPGTAEAAPALLLEALIRPWFGFGRVGVILRGSRLEVVLWICLGAPGPGAETPTHP